MTSDWLTPRQVAERLGVHRKTIYSAIRSGGLRHTRLGRARGHIRIRTSWLDAFIEES